jgi:hypothetical protein
MSKNGTSNEKPATSNEDSAVRNSWADAFVRYPLAPGPQACFPAGKRVAKVKRGKANNSIDRKGDFLYLEPDKSREA